MRKAKDKPISRGQIIRRQSFLFIVPLTLVLAFLLGACGSNGGTSTGAGSTTPKSAPTSVTSKGTLEGCPSAAANPSSAKPNVIINMKNSNSTISAHNGDLIEVRLPFNEKWAGPTTSQGVLELQTPAGYALSSDKVCIWHFVAKGTGTTTLTFTGRAICKAGQLCAMYIMNVPFTIDVK
jgi:hypothetical protein